MSEYFQSIISVSDEQTPFFLSFCSARELLGCEEEAEIISGCLFSSICDNGGIIAARNISGEEILLFLNAKIDGDYTGVGHVLANPTSLLPAIILLYDNMRIPELVDGSIKIFDHRNINIFVPSTYRDFCDLVIEDGINYTYQIGHSIWCVGDLKREWSRVKSEMDTDGSLSIPSIRICSLFASLLRPDREAWYLLD